MGHQNLAARKTRDSSPYLEHISIWLTLIVLLLRNKVRNDIGGQWGRVNCRKNGKDRKGENIVKKGKNRKGKETLLM